MKLRISKIVREKGHDLEWLSKEMGISLSAVKQQVNGNPTKDTLQKFADVLGVHITDLFEKPTQNELTAFVDYNNKVYKAYSIEELKRIAEELEAKKEE